MKITSISGQVKNPNRVNVSVDGKYRFSIDVFQLVDLGIKLGKEYDEDELVALEQESEFSKLYARALEYCLIRPHSAKEIKDYLWRKTLTRKKLITSQKPRLQGVSLQQQREEGLEGKRKIVEVAGVSREVVDRVFEQLQQKGYIDDEKFARFWCENRNQRKGSSLRKLQNELRAKGVENTVIEQVFAESDRNDIDELKKVIAKKQIRYSDQEKFTHYLMRQGFHYNDIRETLKDICSE